MSLPDVQHLAALQEPVIKPVFFAWLDVLGDPVRANTAGANITPAGTGDPDLDGHEFSGLSAKLVEIGSVQYRPGGSESLQATLSGLQGLDDESIALLADPANWRGREARLWRIVRDFANTQKGGFHSYYTGRMVALRHTGSQSGQIISVTIEGYLSVFSEASNRTYLDQEQFDPDDHSARAAIAIANGNYGGAITTGGGGGSGAGSAIEPFRSRLRSF